jgi:hypothetical protein
MHLMRVIAAALTVTLISACGGSAMTPIPAGFPLNACSVAGMRSERADEGFELLPPGSIAFAYDVWHNDTPASFACGAQSVTGAQTVIRRSDLPSGILPWAATYRRALPLQVAEPEPPRARLVMLGIDGETLVEMIQTMSGPQFGGLGNAFEGVMPIPLGRYRMDVLSASGELVASGTFVIVE